MQFSQTPWAPHRNNIMSSIAKGQGPSIANQRTRQFVVPLGQDML